MKSTKFFVEEVFTDVIVSENFSTEPLFKLKILLAKLM